MAKGKSNRRARTDDSNGVNEARPITDAASGDKGNDMNPKNKAEPGLLEVPEDQTSTPPGPAFKDKHDLP